MMALRERFRGTRARDTTRVNASTADAATSSNEGLSALGVIDATHRATSGDAEEIRARLRANAARAEAVRELLRLRSRYWSGERIIEEARTNLTWWEHPDADPYAVLELLPGASIDEAATARRSIARQCHPDLAHLHGKTRDHAMRRMVAANAAYERLRRALRPPLNDPAR